jgi:hypothetical protein
VLRLLNARTGAYAQPRPARGGLLRVCAYVPEESPESGVTGLRVLLVADLLVRAAELDGLQALMALSFPGVVPAEPAVLERDAGALGIHPAFTRSARGDAQASLGGPIDVHVAGHASSVEDGHSGLIVRVASAPVHGRQGQEAAFGSAAGGQDALVVRLALLSFPIGQPAVLTEGALTAARETLRHWRDQVAEWAESPSAPIPVPIMEKARAAFGGLDTASVLTLLGGLAAHASTAAGAKFETFAYADRILGLELAREIGRPR